MLGSHGHSHGGQPCSGNHGGQGGNIMRRGGMSKAPLVMIGALVMFLVYMQYNTGEDELEAVAKPADPLANVLLPRNAAGAVAVVDAPDDAEWRAKLTPQQFAVLRQKATEKPFTGDLYTNKLPGKYLCAACDNLIFFDKHKYASGTGWPSFWDVATNTSVLIQDDWSDGTHRDEVICYRCKSHLGHRFTDGPKPTGLRYCMNSVALKFIERKST